MNKKATRLDGFNLLRDGAVALSKVEANGIRIDVDYLDRTIRKTERRMKKLEDELRQDEVYDLWRREFGRKTNLGSRPQLGRVLFDVMGIEPKVFTASSYDDRGNLKADPSPSVDKEAFARIDLPFVRRYEQLAKLDKAKGTYLSGIRREVCEGFLHPDFLLNMVSTFRSSSAGPNFQNIPVRDPEVGKLIRRAFVPRPGRRLVEIDYGGIEVRISACYHKDPTFLEYVRDPSKDMHRDTAAELFGLKSKEVGKVARYIAKNQFVFPQFYGAYWYDCAVGIWNALHAMNPTVEGSEETVLERLRSIGIKKLGRVDADGKPQPGTFAARVKEVCDSFWNDRFPVYERWKRTVYEEYVNAGRFRMKTGYVEEGLYSRNDTINHRIQGPAFHCLLLSVIKMQAWLERKRMESLLVGQIHDSKLGDVVEGELQAYLTKAKRIMTVEVPKAFPWIIVPLEIEVDVTPVDGSWHEKEPWVEVDGTWQPKTKS